jgi:hypothetical protein
MKKATRQKLIDENNFLRRDCEAMRKAGCNLAQAALYTVETFDGVHRLALAASEWVLTLANEGGRG